MAAACFDLEKLKLELKWDKDSDDKLQIDHGVLDVGMNAFDPARDVVMLLVDGVLVFQSDPAAPPKVKGGDDFEYEAGAGIPGKVSLDLDLGKGEWKFKLDNARLGLFAGLSRVRIDLIVGNVQGALIVPLETKKDDDKNLKLEFDSKVKAACQEVPR